MKSAIGLRVSTRICLEWILFVLSMATGVFFYFVPSLIVAGGRQKALNRIKKKVGIFGSDKTTRYDGQRTGQTTVAALLWRRRQVGVRGKLLHSISTGTIISAAQASRNSGDIGSGATR